MSNPFATRFTQPGRIASLDERGRRIDVDLLIGRLRRLGGSAAIIGPHGSGKSTLLVHLAATIEDRGEPVRRVRLRSWQDVPMAWAAIRGCAAGGTVCIDSWECIGVVARSVLRLAARIRRCGLLVTAHRGIGMPELIRCDTNVSLLRSIVETLPGHDRWHGRLIRDTDIEAAFDIHRGNLRESLYELYDRFESRTKGGGEVWGYGSAEGDGRAGDDHGIHESAGGFSYAGAPERNLG